MVFSSPTFFVFLTAVLIALRLARGVELKKRVLAVASCLFYAAWDWRYLGLLLAVSGIDYLAANRIVATTQPRARRTWLGMSLVSNLGILAYFKYCNFFIDSLNSLVGGAGFAIPAVDVLLPAGISFYTFKTMSYTIDVYRGDLAPCKSWIDYATFVTFFPELIAGPIVRASVFLPQMARDIGPTAGRLALGGAIFVQGLFKKVVLADRLGSVADPVFADPGLHATGAVWFGLLAYALQIYCDFSAYSDMAIGTARMVGYDLPENFATPYLATDIAEFWRRWHMTLSSWLRDYLYIPLGGNRLGSGRTYLNLMATMLLGGLWHGASWNFVLWGGLHGAALAVHKRLREAARGRALLPDPVARLVTVLFVVLAWVPFRSESWVKTELLYARLLGLDGGGFVWWPFWFFACGAVVLAAHAVALGSVEPWERAGEPAPQPRWLERPGFVLRRLGISGTYLLPARADVVPAFAIATLVIVIVIFGETRSNPFIYFQF